MQYETTKKQFKYYKSCVHEYVKHFGLTEWKIVMQHNEVEGGYGACAASCNGRLALIQLASDWDETKPTKKRLKRVALHEVLELLLWELWEPACERYTTEDTLERARHSIIRRLEKMV